MEKYRFKYWFEWGCTEDRCPWSPEEEQSFLKRANEGYLRLQQELGNNYEIEFCI